MKAPFVWPASLVALAAACATSETATPPPPRSSIIDAAVPEAGVSDAAASGDGSSGCEECVLFPETCAPGTFCPLDVPIEPTNRLLAIAGRSESDLWAAGTLGTVLHFDGTSWSRQAMPLEETFGAVLLRGSSETWLGVSLLSTYVSDGGTSQPWAHVSASGTPILAIRSLWSAPDSNWVWAGLQQDNRNSTLARVSRNGSVLTVAAMPNTDPTRAANAIGGISANDLWAVGEGGVAYHVTGAEAQSPLVERVETGTNQTLESLSVLASDDLWVSGTVGTIRHYRGPSSGWETVDGIPTTVSLHGLKALSPTDVWAVGDDATILHYDGTAWSRVPIANLQGTRPALSAVLALAPDRVWVVGQRAVLEYRRGGN